MHPGFDSGPFFSTGTPGSNKSVCGQWIVTQLARQEVPVIALDLCPLRSEQIYSPIEDEVEEKTSRIDLYTDSLTRPLLSPMTFEDGTAEISDACVASISSILPSQYGDNLRMQLHFEVVLA